MQVWRNQGNLSFELVQTLLCGDVPHWAATADVDGDGDPDVVVPAATSGTIHVLHNDGTGQLTERFVLTFLGMPQCWLLVEPNTLWPFVAHSGGLEWRYGIPDQPNLVGFEFFVQVLVFDPFVPNPQNTFGAVVTNALAGIVGY